MVDNNFSFFKDLKSYTKYMLDGEFKKHVKTCLFKDGTIDVYKKESKYIFDDCKNHFNYFYGIKNFRLLKQTDNVEKSFPFAVTRDQIETSLKNNEEYFELNKTITESIIKSFVEYLPENYEDYGILRNFLTAEINCTFWNEEMHDFYSNVYSSKTERDKYTKFIKALMKTENFVIDNGNDDLSKIFGEEFSDEIEKLMLENADRFVNAEPDKKNEFYFFEETMNNLFVVAKSNPSKQIKNNLSKTCGKILASLSPEKDGNNLLKLGILYKVRNYDAGINAPILFDGLDAKAKALYKESSMNEAIAEEKSQLLKDDDYVDSVASSYIQVVNRNAVHSLASPDENVNNKYLYTSFIGKTFLKYRRSLATEKIVPGVRAFLQANANTAKRVAVKFQEKSGEKLAENVYYLCDQIKEKIKTIEANYTRDNKSAKNFMIKAIDEISHFMVDDDIAKNSLPILYFSAGIIEYCIDILFDIYLNSNEEARKSFESKGERYRDREFREISMTYSRNPIISVDTFNIAYFLLYEENWFGGEQLRNSVAHYLFDKYENIEDYSFLMLEVAMSIIDELVMTSVALAPYFKPKID